MVNSVRELAIVDAAQVRDGVFAEKAPCVLRGLAAAWPAVAHGLESPATLGAYLAAFDNGTPVDALLLPPSAGGVIAYNDNLTGFNFARNRLPLGDVIEHVLRYARFANAPTIAAQSAAVRLCLPGFEADNPQPWLPVNAAPRIWLGNRITTPTHVDEWNNLACVVAGRRRFTLFPPEQVENLYIGPLDFAPTGAPMSLVPPGRPDLARFPRFEQARRAACVAELAPGDALFIPPLWWHQVESLDGFNALVNTWWHDRAGDGANADAAFDALLHAILAIRPLPAATREAWARLFHHFAFGPIERSIDHIPAGRRGILDSLDATQRKALRARLATMLSVDRDKT